MLLFSFAKLHPKLMINGQYYSRLSRRKKKVLYILLNYYWKNILATYCYYGSCKAVTHTFLSFMCQKKKRKKVHFKMNERGKYILHVNFCVVFFSLVKERPQLLFVGFFFISDGTQTRNSAGILKLFTLEKISIPKTV